MMMTSRHGMTLLRTLSLLRQVHSSMVAEGRAGPGLDRHATSKAVINGALETVRILFCSPDFQQGFSNAKKTCGVLPGVEVERCLFKDLAKHIGSADILVPLMARLDRNLLQQANNTKLILQFGVGLEGVDVQAATELGIQVSNMPSGDTGNALSCAEMAIHLLFMCLRHHRQMEESVQSRVLGYPHGKTLFGTTTLIIGFGNISKMLVPRLKAFGTRVMAVRQSKWGDSDVEAMLDKRGRWQDLYEYTAQADNIVLGCSQNQETMGLVNKEFLSHCKKGFMLVNVARGGLLDYEAVKEGLETAQIGALGADVMWSEPFDPTDPIAQHPRVYLTPHVAGVTELSYWKMAERLAEEAQRLQKGLPATVQVNTIPHWRHCNPNIS